MPQPKRGPRLGAGPAHQKLLLSNQAQELFRHGRITTTEAKAKQLRPFAERLITKAKQGDLHARRQVLAKVRDRDVVAYLFEDIAPRFADRPGGYTRILKLGPRRGDNAPMAIIELVDQGVERGDEVIEEAKRGRTRGIFGRRRRRREEPVEAGFAEDLDLEDEIDETVLPDLEDDEDTTPPDVDVEPSDADLPAVEDDTEAPSDVPTATAPDETVEEPDLQRDPNPDAGDTTGGSS